jgi:hypothetical protein
MLTASLNSSTTCSLLYAILPPYALPLSLTLFRSSAPLPEWRRNGAYRSILVSEYHTSEYRRLDDRSEELTEEEAPLGAFEVLP